MQNLNVDLNECVHAQRVFRRSEALSRTTNCGSLSGACNYCFDGHGSETSPGQDAAGGWGRHLELDRRVPLYNVEQLPFHDKGLPSPSQLF